MFEELTSEATFTRIEEEVWRYWRRYEVPEAFHAPRRERPPFVLNQQPFTATGEALIDQVQAMVVTDLLARFHAMRGDAVQYIAGWVCHGLPIEVAVEHALGPEVMNYDLAQFNSRCRQAVLEGVERGEVLAERLAAWPAPGNRFLSLEPQAIGLVWSALRRLWEEGRVRRDQRVVPVCPRCASPLSAAEAGRRIVDAKAHSVWVRLPWESEPNTYLLAWTPTPWMLTGMVALAVHPEVQYAVVEPQVPVDHPQAPSEVQTGRLLLAETALRQALPGQYRVVRRILGRTLRGARYHPPFTFLPAGERRGQILLSDQVPLDRGTGLWPVTPTFDPLSLTLAQAHDLSLPELLDDWGAFDQVVTPWRGLSPQSAESLIIEDLRLRDLLLRDEESTRAQALCPHCETALLPLARAVWRVETGSGPWIVSRDRAWGVPLPIWACTQCGEEVIVAGLDDLAQRTVQDVDEIDPHRPAVDRLSFPCKRCQGTMRRSAGVLDAAFEAAVLSWSTSPQRQQANVAVGLGDVDVGWLGDLAEIAALLDNALAWEQAVALPQRGQQEDWDLERIPSADAVRWAACAGTAPDQAQRDFLRPLWRLVVAFLSPAGSEQASIPISGQQSSAHITELLGRWLEARLYQATQTVTNALDAQEPGEAARELADLLEDLDSLCATARPRDVNQALSLLGRLLAPFVPYLAEAIYRRAAGRTESSVHLGPWPVADRRKADRTLLTHMAHVRRLVSLGQRARAQGDVGDDQRLPRAILRLPVVEQDEILKMDELVAFLAERLGVETVQFSAEANSFVDWRVTVESSPEVNAALASLPPTETAEMASQLRSGLSVSLQLTEQTITVLPDEVTLSPQPRPGWAAASSSGYLVVLEVG
jgi:isoleucyl-tRNA synthetase